MSGPTVGLSDGRLTDGQTVAKRAARSSRSSRSGRPSRKSFADGNLGGSKEGMSQTCSAVSPRALIFSRVGSALGARPETFYGLSGFGDLVATCHGAWSRNREFGQRIGEGRSAAELIAHRKTVVEGYRTTESFHGLCVERKIDAPILREMHAILFEGKAPALALHTLMLRGLKRE